ncbi:MAG: hypothetical protein DCC75_04170 [Proteobacteria bacterium]|nr:MAG: hypothetical protein DCC75_04170 [Pseudomonadota bacterium]
MDQASLADHSIAREFVDSIQSLDISIPSDFNPESGLAQAARQHCIGPNDLLIWVDGDPVINFDRHEFKGKKLLEVARLKPGKIWQWYAKFDFGLPEEECLHVRKIMWYLDKYHLGRDRLGAYIRSSEKFLDWLRRSGFDQVNYDPDTNKFSLRTH